MDVKQASGVHGKEPHLSHKHNLNLYPEIANLGKTERSEREGPEVLFKALWLVRLVRVSKNESGGRLKGIVLM